MINSKDKYSLKSFNIINKSFIYLYGFHTTDRIKDFAEIKSNVTFTFSRGDRCVVSEGFSSPAHFLRDVRFHPCTGQKGPAWRMKGKLPGRSCPDPGHGADC